MASAATAGTMTTSRRFGKPYTLLLIVTLSMVTIGLVMILSASSVEAYKRYGSSFLFFNKQVIGAAVGVLVMLVISRTDFHILRRLAAPMMLVALACLIAVLIPGVGTTVSGSSRWIPLGPFNLQPSEFGKLALIIYSAHILERKGKAIRQAREMALPLLPIIGLIGLLVMAQPDMGTAIICAGCGFIVLFLSGARGSHLALLVIGGGVAMTGLALNETYRRARIGSFLNPWADPLNSGYQNIQGQIALGTGRLFGLGLGPSRQKWSYFRNAQT
ncbi:MAG: FtsW/RodA/SpoVE family cell cycle protein, partial [Actinobacteria bacterium]|nr:FtsW/RodA/SpoVE family cell cycle protein [Actinomycetota bacterium]